MATGLHGFGATLTATAGTATTTLGQITRVSAGPRTRDALDISSMGSTNKAREFIPGMIDNGEMTIDINYEGDSTNSPKLLDPLMTATAYTWKVELNDAGTTNKSSFACDGFLTSLLVAEIPFDDKVTATCTVKLTGESTYTEHS